MTKGRLEAFSDGVIAIILTIMVLELKLPNGVDWGALAALAPVFFSYVLSFAFLGIYWNNHHHLLQAAQHVDGLILWANLHLLFWLSLIPFVTGWMGHTHFAPVPVAVYGVVMLLSGSAYFALTRALLRRHGPDSALARAVGRDTKGIVSLLLYIAAVPLSFVAVTAAVAIYMLVSVIWLIPDRRIERTLER